MYGKPFSQLGSKMVLGVFSVGLVPHSSERFNSMLQAWAFMLESNKAAQKLIERELEPWETVAVGALSGGLAAVLTTPFDVIKTRTMTAPPGRHVTLSVIAFSVLHHEGPLRLFKGAVPRFFWIAPLGAMNFAAYELAKKAMDKNRETGEPTLQK